MSLLREVFQLAKGACAYSNGWVQPLLPLIFGIGLGFMFTKWNPVSDTVFPVLVIPMYLLTFVFASAMSKTTSSPHLEFFQTLPIRRLALRLFAYQSIILMIVPACLIISLLTPQKDLVLSVYRVAANQDLVKRWESYEQTIPQARLVRTDKEKITLHIPNKGKIGSWVKLSVLVMACWLSISLSLVKTGTTAHATLILLLALSVVGLTFGLNFYYGSLEKILLTYSAWIPWIFVPFSVIPILAWRFSENLLNRKAVS